MVLILDDNSEIGAHVLSEIGNSTCFRHLFRSTAVADLKLAFKIHEFPSCVPNEL